MTDTKKASNRKPGEKPPGKFHYNPVNMAGKKTRFVERDTKDMKETTNKPDARPQKD